MGGIFSLSKYVVGGNESVTRFNIFNIFSTSRRVVGYTYDLDYTKFQFERGMKIANEELEYLLARKHDDDFYESKRPYKMRTLMSSITSVPPSFRLEQEFIDVCNLMAKLGLKVPPPIKYSIVEN